MIYLDNAATTQIRAEVLTAMTPFLTELYGNPSSIYSVARESKKAVENARAQVAAALNADKNSVIFTSGGSEADNWALMQAPDKSHIITSCIEHHAVLHKCEELEKNGFSVTYLPVDEYGLVSPEKLQKAVRPDTGLISIMYANNEIGTIQPIAELAKIAKERNIPFHTDAVQAVGHVPIDLSASDIDFMSISAHKLYGPKGIGALYAKNPRKLRPFIHGGAQERNKRAGTENVAGIVGFGEAITLLRRDLEKHSAKTSRLRDMLIDGILTNIPNTRLNGHPAERLCGNVNISFEFIEGESLLLHLDMKGICGSSGSACTSGALDPSHVLLGIGLDHATAHGSLRLSVGIFNTEDEIKTVLDELVPIVRRLRDMSPLYNARS